LKYVRAGRGLWEKGFSVNLKSLLPDVLLQAYRRYKRARVDRRNASRTPMEVFSEIYSQKVWGGTGPFNSGAGSETDSIVGPYVATIKKHLRSHGSGKPKVVDLGCGDFFVGSRLIEECSEYIGVDVVPDLVKHLQTTAGSEHVRFTCLDIVADELPAGDICLIRQVLQRLGNEQIGKVLAKLGRYRTVFVTEHYPEDGPTVIPNVDKVHGGGIRLYDRSGVYLDKPPFDLPSSNMELILEVPGRGCGGLDQEGVIRTFRIDFPDSV